MVDSDKAAGRTATEPRYWAFLSYSHRDRAFAERLHRALETYKVPRELVGRTISSGTVGQRLFPVFRDREELPSAPDLGTKIREALAASRWLIVIASPASARSPWVDLEIRSFKAMGRADRVLAIIIDGEPNMSGRPGREDEECFCPALRFTVDDRGALTDTHAEPIAADARPEGDGEADAVLKLIAGLLEVGFDALKQRERTRRRRRLALAGAAWLGVTVAAGMGYLALADLGVAVPGDDAIRRAIDRREQSLFRAVPPGESIAAAATRNRCDLRARLVAIAATPEFRDRSPSAWADAQIAAALARDPDSRASEIALATELIRGAMQLPTQSLKGVELGWIEPNGAVARAEPALWLIMAIGSVLPRLPDAAQDVRRELVGYLGLAQETADTYQPLGDGGFNGVPMRDPADDHFTYTTALALQAMLDTRRARQCWRDDCAQRDAMIARTASWLSRAFVDGSGETGWRLTEADDKPPNRNLGGLVLAALGRARLDAGFALDPRISEFAYRYFTEAAQRDYGPSFEEISQTSAYRDETGQRRVGVAVTRLLWYPWTAAGLAVWSRLAEQDRLPPERQVALKRSQARLAITLSASMREEMATNRSLVFHIAETQFGLAQAAAR